jgi:hypothetical protein
MFKQLMAWLCKPARLQPRYIIVPDITLDLNDEGCVVHTPAWKIMERQYNGYAYYYTTHTLGLRSKERAQELVKHLEGEPTL